MEVSLTPEQEARLQALAARSGAEAGDLVRGLVQRALDHEDWFRREVEKGVDQADQGELIDHEAVVRVLHHAQRWP
ncbi:MAG: hypothetical protein GC160_09630 [Acidobacteria bacterium]|nr:hypothetical protein [Acidobacteriota bacterium]